MAKIYDLLLKNVKIIDGTGAPAYYGNIGIVDDVIADIGETLGDSKNELDCTGLVAAPGFIDIHTHGDIGVMYEPLARNYIHQGVTTLVTGNCGYSGAPVMKKNLPMFDRMFEKLPAAMQKQELTFGDFLELLDKTPKGINIATLIGHGNIRGGVAGMENVKPSSKEIQAMKGLVKEAMESGAFGMSTGLIYDPGVFADTVEIAELAKVVREYGGIYATHVRNESDLLIDAVLEAIQIGKQSGVRVEVSHHKASGKRNWGLLKTTLGLMEYYRRFGVEVTCDVYPCTFSNTGLYDCLPAWIRGEAFKEMIKDDDNKARLKQELSRPSTEFENIILDAEFDGIIISSSQEFKEYEGKSIADISQELQKDPYDTIFYLLEREKGIQVLAGGMSEEDIRYVIQHDLSMICSDSSIIGFGEGLPHPRGYMAFTKIISQYVREEGLISLEAAVKKMSYMPAWKLGLRDRGLLKPGFKADISVFDYWNVNYTSNYSDPHHYSTGMVHVLVNGKPAILNQQHTGAIPGKVLRKR
ncbi:MAG: D-aminoacylase [Tepidanaerobacteraceae bacterium]|nr:D-aminoacylase [Tepidanaerobacteraceae bacterium]